MGILRIIFLIILFTIPTLAISVINQPLPLSEDEGDVYGPATNTDLHVPQWDGNDTKKLRDGFPISAQGQTWVNLSSTANMRNNLGLSNHQLITVSSSGIIVPGNVTANTQSISGTSNLTGKVRINTTSTQGQLNVSGDVRVTGNIYTTGSSFNPIATVTGNVTVNLNQDLLLCDATSATVNISLPAVSGKSGLSYRIKKIAGSYPVIIDPNSSEQIDGATTFTISALYSSIQIRTNGTAWWGF